MQSFDFKKFEKKWSKKWKEENLYHVRDSIQGKKNFYELVMFPYPSGNLHIGHWYNFAPADIVARFKRMKGYNVLHPIGFDAFGLPAENAAIKRGVHPKIWTYKNMSTMRTQLDSMGTLYDWDRMIITADSQYYKWTQWIFLELFKKGLAYRKNAAANWCPSCHTVLANEQVVDGKCERCGTEVIQKIIEQWLFKITEYAQKLLDDLEPLDWPTRTKAMQRNWIGRSEGTLVKFPIKNSQLKIEVFTTRIDTLFGATYMVLAPEHELVQKLQEEIQNWKEVERYIHQAHKKTEIQRTDTTKDKTGIELKGTKAINPANLEEIPIFIADYVLSTYGTGAIMAVPAHDARDFEFAKKFNISITQVISSSKENNLPYEGEGVLINSGKFNGLDIEKAKKEISHLVAGKQKVNFRLRDWLISRQRYWGSPIPLVYCEDCKSRVESRKFKAEEFTKGELINPGWIAVPEKQLPIELPNVKNYLPTDEGKSPLAHAKGFINTTCPKCGGKAVRETDTMDTFVCSSWYYLRYADPQNNKTFADKKKIKAWLPVDLYIGGAEHSVLHLLYARFFTKVLKDVGHISFKEPFKALRHQGIILGPDNQKMSKSRGNVIDPDDLVKEFGADAVRTYLCFMGPYEQGGPWQPGGIIGIARFLQRVWNFYVQKNRTFKKVPVEIERVYHQTVEKVTKDIEQMSFNTAVSSLMVLLREIEGARAISKEMYEGFLKLLAPFAPFMSEEIWREILGNKQSIADASWPSFNKKKAQDQSVTVVVQVNGKKRGVVLIAKGADQEMVLQAALQEENTQKHLEGKEIRKTIFVPDKIINIII